MSFRQHPPTFGDVYQHVCTQAPVIVLKVKKVAGRRLVRVARFGRRTVLEMGLDAFLRKFEWLGLNVRTEREKMANEIDNDSA